MTVTELIFMKSMLAGQLSVKNSTEFNGKSTNDFMADSRLHEVLKCSCFTSLRFEK
jgi:hypothetical protein